MTMFCDTGLVVAVLDVLVLFFLERAFGSVPFPLPLLFKRSETAFKANAPNAPPTNAFLPNLEDLDGFPLPPLLASETRLGGFPSALGGLTPLGTLPPLNHPLAALNTLPPSLKPASYRPI